jgi:sugar lactone lactonase YvrE
MFPHYFTPTLTLAAALALGSSACSPRDTADRTGAASDTAAVAGSETSGRMATKIGELRDQLQAPEAVRYDSDQKIWFVANINGEPGGKDNNGYISRITPEGKVETARFIAGGVKGVTLNAPKGMAISGDTLWVADIDAARAFNRRTGAAITSVKVTGAKFLNDAVAGPDGVIYLTDTGVAADFSHPGPDRIYQIKGGKASVALESADLSGPNGIAWVPDENEFVIVPFLGTNIVAWKPGEKTVRTLGTGPGQQDGVAVLPDGGLLITSWTDSSLFVLKDGRSTRVAYPVPSAADIGFDGKSRVAVPLLAENRVEFWNLP